jgi:hypothetical protein
MQTHFPWKELGYAACAGCLLLALYVGSYFAFVTSVDSRGVKIAPKMVPVETEERMPGGRVVQRVESVQVTEQIPVDGVLVAYRFKGVLGRDLPYLFYAPAHDLDRRLRTEFWKNEIRMAKDEVFVPTPPAMCPTAFYPPPAGVHACCLPPVPE